MSYFEELFRLASLITADKKELGFLINKGNVDVYSKDYLSIVGRLKELILEENKIIMNLSIEDVEETFNSLKMILQLNSTLEFYDKLNSYEEIESYLTGDFKKSEFVNSNLGALQRVFYRLKNKGIMLTDGCLELEVGKEDKATTYVSKWDALESVIQISVLKLMEGRIDALSVENDDEEIEKRDKKIVKEIRDNLLKYYFNVAFSNFDIEFRSVFSDFNLSKLKCPDIAGLVVGKIFSKDELDAYIYNELKDLLEEFLCITCFDSVYNANNLFSMLRGVTSIEVLLPYVNINMINDDTCLDILCDIDGQINKESVNRYVRERVRWV